jgi:predicted phage terminase large subunit-like protein
MTILVDRPVSPWEAAARMFEPPPPRLRRWETPGVLAGRLDQSIVQTPALDLIDDALVELFDTPGQQRLAVFMAPQEGKSERVSHYFPLWALCDNPDLRIAIVSHSAELALGFGRSIKNDVESNDGTDGTLDLGLRLRKDSKAAGRWNIEGYRGSVYATSVAGNLTGKPADLILLDDPIADLERAMSIKYRERAHRFWLGVAVPRMGPNTKVCLIQTRWHEDDLAGRLLATEGDKVKGGRWKVISIPAQCEDEGSDPLGRKRGEYMVSTRGRTTQDWDDRKKDMGAYVWSALCQQRPAPAEGGMFKRIWWRFWSPAPALFGERIDCAGRIWPVKECWRFATIDLAASTKTSSDWTVVSAWMLTGDGDLVLLDRNRARVGEADHFTLVRPLVERWALDTVFVEASQHSTTLVTEAAHSGIPVSPLTADTDKLTRAIPASARASNGRVWLPAGAPWLAEWIGEHASFPNGTHDDQVDTLAYAVRIAITKWAPPPPKPSLPPSGEIDLMTVPM